eukprot:9294656-Pyramimonas_sp.AAC.1
MFCAGSACSQEEPWPPPLPDVVPSGRAVQRRVLPRIPFVFTKGWLVFYEEAWVDVAPCGCRVSLGPVPPITRCFAQGWYVSRRTYGPPDVAPSGT